MSKTPDQISAQILASLAITIPGLSCQVGTPERKIVDAVSEAISEAYVDQYLVGSLMDIDTKSGLELEQFCLVPGTPVTTPSGVKVIESLRVGDEVVTHTGKVAEILATSARAVDESVVTIRTAVGVEYTMTKNHPVWITRRSSMTMLASQVGNWRRDGSKGARHALRLRGLGSRTVWDSRDLDRDFVPAGEVMPGDIVWGPDPGLPGTKNTLSVPLKRLLGYYLAEGHIHHRKNSSEIGFTFHRDEIEYQDEVEHLLRSEWNITHIHRQNPNNNSTQLICYSTKLAHWLEGYVGKGAESKHIPFGMEAEDWTPLLATYWRGDGTVRKGSMRAKTVSVTLAWQLYDQMIRLGLSPRMTKEANAGSVIIMSREVQRRDTWQVSVDGESARLFAKIITYPLLHQNAKDYARVSVRQDGFIGSAVVRVTESYYRGNVYNIEVAGDNSYELTGSFGVHNCGIFGFGRLQGKAAEGTVRITSLTARSADTTYQASTQFYTTPGLAGIPTQLYYTAKQTVIMVAGDTTCDVPVQCTTVGSIGNVPPDSITFAAGALGGASCTNLAAMTGGVDIETDAELRQRFKDTMLRNISGTSDWYEALCQQNTNVSRVVVFGPLSLYQTQISVPSTTLTLPVNQDVKYAWNNMESVFTELGQEDETFYSAVDDYVYSGGTSPTFQRVSTGALNAGDVVDLEFQYTTRSSRNDPINGITNKVDVFVDGVNPYAITEKSVISATTLNTTTSSPFYTGNFVRVGSGGSPTSGNRFMRLGSTPVISFPSTLTVGGTTYTQGTHYFLLQDTTLLQGTQLENSGIEWTAAGPSTGTELTLNYVYNQVPEILNALVASTKQVTTDVLVHQGDAVFVQPCLQVEYDRSYSVATVNAAIQNRLQQYFSQMPFGAQIKLSNITMFVQQTLGVVDVKVTTSTDNPSDYGIQLFNNSTDTVPALVETGDFKLNDNQLANYQGVLLTRVAAP